MTANRNGAIGRERYAPPTWVPPSLHATLRDGATDLCGIFEARAWSKPDDVDKAVQAFLGVFPAEWVAEIVGPDFKALTAREVLARLEVHHG